MKKTLLLLLTYITCQDTIAQSTYWQQEVNFEINVRLNDKSHTLDGFEKIQYVNHSPDTLTYIWFHIWPNAYKHDKTALSDQLLENGNTDFYFSSKENKGYINRLDFRVNNQVARIADHPQHVDIIQLFLPTPLLPGATCEITTPFHVKLPYNYSRSGHDGESYQVTQWYPKPAVYDARGWHPMPYLDQGEFYSEFGKYTVDITVPANYVVAATGDLQNEEEKTWLRSRSRFTWKPTKKKIKSKSGSIRYEREKFPPSETATKTLRYTQDRVHDFAWFADKRFLVEMDTAVLANGRAVDVWSFYTEEEKGQWSQAVRYAKDAVKTRSAWIGEYPYNIVSVVQGPQSFGGGMEYPTITVISPQPSGAMLDVTIGHEIGHNWFYGVLASNERQYPWLDEGLNTYYDNRYSKLKYGAAGEMPVGHSTAPLRNSELLAIESLVAERMDQPINLPATEFNEENYNLVPYQKTAAWLELIEKRVGTATLDSAMRDYYRTWQFRHPQPENFRKHLETASGQTMSDEFALLNKKGLFVDTSRKKLTAGLLITPKGKAAFLRNNPGPRISFWPVLGFNNYDKLMAGAMVTNMTLPSTRFQFLAIPMYSTGVKKVNGIGLAAYSFYPQSTFRKIDVGISGSAFTRDRYEDTLGNKTYMGFTKLVPGVRFTLQESHARSTFHRYFQFKTFFINEDYLTIARDSIFTPTDTTVVERAGTRKEDRTLAQLLFVVENYRALYPYRAEFKAEHGKGFLRFAFTGNYFLNYPAKKGGVDLRLFAGKFIYTNKSKADPFLYGLNLSAPKGDRDYTYSDYFIGRNDYPFRITGVEWTVAYQQIMIRDGALKVNTDGQENTGASDNWLAAINGAFDIPERMNPLSVLPFNIGLKVFVDAGTYAAAWEKNATGDRFLYDAGFQLSLFKEVLNIYIPVLYSPVFKDYKKSVLPKKNNFLKTIAFSIDIQKFNSKRFTRSFRP